MAVRLVLMLLTFFTAAIAAGEEKPRATPPEWSADVVELFFADLSDALQGERPNYAELHNSKSTDRPPGHASESDDFAWMQLIDASTIETEVKRRASNVERLVKTAGPFKAGGHQACRQDFTMLAVLFAVAGEFEGDVRWQRIAPSVRDVLARTARECQVGTDRTYTEAVLRSELLQSLIRGTPGQLAPANQIEGWHRVADRPVLMQHFEEMHQDSFTNWLADKRQFRRHRDEIIHDARLAAMLAHVIHQAAFDYWDDDMFVAYARELGSAAQDLAEAAERAQYEQAQAALNRATKACSKCHEGYRG